MNLKFRKDVPIGVICPTSMGMRLVPDNGQAVYCTDRYTLTVCSAETNVVQISASLGIPGKALTTFVEGSPMAWFIKDNLRRRNIQYEGPEVPQGGPWGYRHQFNIADSGFGTRGPRVWNDRTGEVGRTLNAKDFDLDRIFGKEGAQIVHMSGLVAALSPESGKFCLAVAEAAKKYGTLVSFDINHRASFWVDREEELRDVFHRIASMADILIGNEEDFQLALGIKGPEHGGKDVGAQIEDFKEMINRVKAAYPQVQAFGNTLRSVISVGEHMWGSIMRFGDEWNVIPPREIQVYDRIGGGDGFVGGMLYGLMKGWPIEKVNSFAWATGALATTVVTDYAMPCDEDQVWSIYEGNARVKR
jgi:2-dehydro-3-deoxygluconokinase